MSLNALNPVDGPRLAALLAAAPRQDGSLMAHALATFIRERMDERNLRNRDVVAASGLSRALVSKYATDKRDKITRMPERSTVVGLAKALGVSPDFLLAKAIESLGLGYTSGDFINSVESASSTELLEEIGRRLSEQGGVESDAGSAANNLPTLGEGREQRRRKTREQAMPQERAAYDTKDEEGEAPSD